uniref:Putative cytochrome c oxidase subunit vib/cox12 n=1 Tax=Ixodes ricinus TaxID=34613 RepID=A0A131YB97_IXORI
MSFPNKEQRQKCWDSRDRYWECLDRNPDDPSPCDKIKAEYQSLCPSQWVKHFNRKREYLKFKDKIENEGRSLGKTGLLLDPGDSQEKLKRAVT